MTRNYFTISAVVLVLLNAPLEGGESSVMRTWTSAAGTHVRAALVDVEGQHARLRREDGPEITVPIDKLSTSDQEFIGQWLDRAARKPSDAWRLFKSQVTGEEFRGRIVQRINVKGRRKLEVRDATGKTGYVWEDEWQITDAPGDGRESNTGGTSPQDVAAGGSAGRGVTKIKPLGSPSGPIPASNLLPVVVTGVGMTPEEAKQNAFSNAIEQAVGVLVEATTLVENEELVRDQVLTFSRGYVKSSRNLSQWEKNGLHYARILAEVELEPLKARLRENKLTVASFPGELLSRQYHRDQQNTQSAAEMLIQRLEGFSPDQFLKVEPLGEPEIIKRDELTVRLRVRVKVTSDMALWKPFAEEMRGTIARVSAFYFDYPVNRVAGGSEWYGGGDDGGAAGRVAEFSKRAKEPGIWLHVLLGITPDGHNTYRTMWRTGYVPASLAIQMVRLLEDQWKLRAALLRANDQVVVEAEQLMISDPIYQSPVRSLSHIQCVYRTWDGYYLGPFFWHNRHYAPLREFEFEFEVSADDLGDIQSVVAYIEKVSRQ